MSAQGFGAYTGETSALHLTDLGIQHTLVGHSERRHIYNESDSSLLEKTKISLDNKLQVIFCIGELLSDRESNNTENVVATQLEGLKTLPLSTWANIVLAYEPVWAIGTGVVATPEQAQDTHAFIRSWVSQNINSQVAEGVRIIYGGSVTDGNCKDLIARTDIDGFLIGGVSLKPAFKTVVNISQDWLR